MNEPMPAPRNPANDYGAVLVTVACNSVLPLVFHLGARSGDSGVLSVAALMLAQAVGLALWLIWTRKPVMRLLPPEFGQRAQTLFLPPPVVGRGGRWAHWAMSAVSRAEFLVLWAGIVILDASAVAITAGLYPVFLVLALAWLFNLHLPKRHMILLLSLAAVGVVCVGISREGAVAALAGASIWRIALGIGMGIAAACCSTLSVSSSLLNGRRTATVIGADHKIATWSAILVVVVSLSVAGVIIGAVGLVLSHTLSWRGTVVTVATGLLVSIATVAVRAANLQAHRPGINLLLLAELLLAQVWLRIAGVSFGDTVPFLIGAGLIAVTALQAQRVLQAPAPTLPIDKPRNRPGEQGGATAVGCHTP